MKETILTAGVVMAVFAIPASIYTTNRYFKLKKTNTASVESMKQAKNDMEACLLGASISLLIISAPYLSEKLKNNKKVY